jgi:hypothetical protein
MKNFRTSALLAAFTLALLLSFHSAQASADTLNMQLVGVGGQQSNGSFVYPYYASVDGSSKPDAVMCISFFNDVFIWETWKVTVAPIVGTLDEEAAYLYHIASTGKDANTIADAQWAAWELFATGVPAPDQTGVTADLNQAAAFAANPANQSFYANFELLVPVVNSQNMGGLPQTFVTTAPTPEPDSLFLLGTGLFALATYMTRKKQVAPAISAQNQASQRTA